MGRELRWFSYLCKSFGVLLTSPRLCSTRRQLKNNILDLNDLRKIVAEIVHLARRKVSSFRVTFEEKCDCSSTTSNFTGWLNKNKNGQWWLYDDVSQLHLISRERLSFFFVSFF